MGGAATDGPPTGGGPHAFVDDIERPELAGADRDHLERSLRLRSGDPLTISDGDGRWRSCRFGPELEVAGPVRQVALATPAITIAFALTKRARPELTVQKLTELGVDRIVPYVADRSIVRWDPSRAERNGERFRRIARESAMQSRRVRLPIVEAVMAFADVAGRPGAALLDGGGGPPSLEHPLLLVGPEGGWSPTERDSGLPRVALGPQVLRAETAALAGAAVLGAIRARLVASL